METVDRKNVPGTTKWRRTGNNGRTSRARRITANARSDQRWFFRTQKRLFWQYLAFMPEGQPPRVGIREPLEVVAFQGHRLGLDTAMVVLAIAVVMPVVMGVSRLILMLATSVCGQMLRRRMGVIRTDDADIQAGHHAKNHQP